MRLGGTFRASRSRLFFALQFLITGSKFRLAVMQVVSVQPAGGPSLSPLALTVWYLLLSRGHTKSTRDTALEET
jgi:hypothetical protein